jgi:stage IV sporulation protein B
MTKLKRFFYFILFFILIIILAYISDITNIPSNIILLKDEELNIKKLIGITIDTGSDDKSIIQAVSSDEEQNGKIGINLFGIHIKDVNISNITNTEVMLCGNLIGMKLYTNGVLVVGMSEIYGQDNNIYKPYETTGIEEGDTILKINEKNISSTNELISSIKDSDGNELKITYSHNDKTIDTVITPIQTETDEYKIGLWVRDTAAGVGTATFYNEDSGIISTLGHGLIDVDTEQLIDISSGELTTTNIVSLQKGENGTAGKIQGTVDGQPVIGEIIKNTYFGVYAKINDIASLKIDNTKKIQIASRDEIKKGSAKVLCSIDTTGDTKEYDIEIKKIYTNNNTNNKSMLVEITDEELIEKTGGIIQGMSGSPIVQNGKLIGALTHVLVQDSKKGYAVFADLMLKEMEE